MEMGLYLFISYFLGTCMTAWLVGRVSGVNLQTVNSGNLGARNAGRALGKKAFIITVLGDGGKGVAIVFIGRFLGFSNTIVALAVALCVIGHLYPFWLRFKGGKGVATCIGAMLFLSPTLFVGFIVGLLIGLLLTRSLTLSMIVGFFTYSLTIFVMDSIAYWPVLIAVVLVVWHHRQNIRERVVK